MWIWMISNLSLLARAYVNSKWYWAGRLSVRVVAVLYLVFTGTNFYWLAFGEIV